MSDDITLLPALLELRTRSQWVCWRREQRGADLTKVPYNPRTGERAASNGPTTWADYSQAIRAWQGPPARYDGIGYMFHHDFTGIDLDHCIDEAGRLEPWASRIIKELASYAETSPSET